MTGVNRQGHAHIVSTAIVSPGSGKGGREVEATPSFRTWLSIDPQPASTSPTINVSIIFICAFLVDCGWTIRIRQSKTILDRDKPGQGVVAIVLQSFPNGVVGFIDWLDATGGMDI